MICGGSNRKTCYALYNEVVGSNGTTAYNNSTEWVEAAPMLEARKYAASAKVLEAGLLSEYVWWVSGGLDRNEQAMRSSEIRWLNGSWTTGPQLPRKLYGHCAVQIQRDKTLIIGGHSDGHYLHTALMYDWNTKARIGLFSETITYTYSYLFKMFAAMV